MLRRKSEFFVFLDSVRSVKSEKEEQKEEDQLSPYEEYLQVLLQMRMTSAVSEQKLFLEDYFSHSNWGWDELIGRLSCNFFIVTILNILT